MAGGVAGDVDVEAAVVGPEAFAAEVPFAEVPGDVAGGLEGAGGGEVDEEVVGVGGGEEFPDGVAAEVVGDAGAGGVKMFPAFTAPPALRYSLPQP